MKLQDRLKEVRKDNKLSQEDFGKSIGVSKSLIACYESGYRDITDRAINDICREYGVSKDWLLTGVGKKYNITEEDKQLQQAFAQIEMSENDKLKKIAANMLKLNDEQLKYVTGLIDLLLQK